MNIAVTGISGYMGQKLVSRLLQDPDIKITGIDMKNTVLPDGHQFYQVDTREARIKEIFKMENIDTVIHMAFLMPPFKNKKLAYSINVEGTKNILHASRAAGVKKIVIPSSTVVYGAHPDNPLFLKEDSPYRGNPEYYYYHDKVEVEKLCLSFFRSHPEMDYIIFRMCEVYGPETDMYYSKALEKKNVYLFEGHDPAYQFLHEKDMIECSYKAIKKKNIKGVFNLVPDDVIPLSEAVRAAGGRVKWSTLSPFLIKMCALLYKLNLFETPVASFSYWQYPWTASNEKLKRELGYKPVYTSLQALNSKYKQDGNGPSIAINQNLCNSCMNCLNNCPVNIFQKQNGSISVKNTELCISCGHCMILCPQKAINHSFFKDRKMYPVSANGSLSYNSFVNLLKTRRSIRTFRGKSLSDNDIERIICAAGLAPSAHNIQSTKYMVIKEAEILSAVKENTFLYYKKMYNKLKNPLNKFFATLLFGREMKKIIKEMEIMLTEFKHNKDPFLHNAGCLLLFYSEPTLRSPDINAQLACSHAMLAAHSLAIGTCYAGYVVTASKSSKKLRTLLQMPKKCRVHAALVLGYARLEYPFFIEKKKSVIYKKY
jgi:UDP-glucose 4-epimerase